MNKFKKWLKENKGLTILLALTFILLVFISVIFFKLFLNSNSDKYGNRLDGIENVVIAKDTYEKIEKSLMDSKYVKNVSTRLQGRIVYTTVVLNNDVNVDTAKGLANKTLENFSEEQLKYYDYEFFLKWEKEESDMVITGSRHHNKDKIVWTNN